MSAPALSTRPAAANASRPAAATSATHDLIFSREVIIGATGERVKAGTPVAEVAKKPWFNEAWKRDAISCGTLAKPEPAADQE